MIAGRPQIICEKTKVAGWIVPALALTSIDEWAAAYAPPTIMTQPANAIQFSILSWSIKITATPTMPIKTAMIFCGVMLSFGRRIHASTRPKTVMVDCSTAARPDVMYCSLQKTRL